MGDYRLKATGQQEQFALLLKDIEVFNLQLFLAEYYELIRIIVYYWELNRAGTNRIGLYDYFSRIIVKKIE